MPASSIPDDGTLEAALYGSAHIETVLAKENGTKLMQVFDERIEFVLSSLDLELAAIILSEARSWSSRTSRCIRRHGRMTSSTQSIRCVTWCARSLVADWSNHGWTERSTAGG